MVDSDIIAQKLERLKYCVKQLRFIQKQGKKKVCKNDISFAAMERFLQIAVESVLGVGNHIIAGLNMRKPSTYEQILQILCEEKIIPKKVFAKGKPIPTLRMMLVHDNQASEREKEFNAAHELLPVLEDLARVYRKFL